MAGEEDATLILEVPAPLKRFANNALFICAALISTILFSSVIAAQCVAHPEQKTAVRFGNDTFYELTFFIDTDETGIEVPMKSTSPEQFVEAGRHMFRARAMVGERSIWVWVINDIPEGQVCTWTVTDQPLQAVPDRSS